MSIDQFVAAYEIKPADAIVVRKEIFGLFDHYVIYLGKDRNEDHKLIANYGDGIKFISNSDFINFVSKYTPVRINRFVGNEIQRNSAVQRALSRLNEKAYNLIVNNCEHFANWVQKGLPSSEQVEDLGKGMAVVGSVVTIAGLASKNKNVAIVGGLVTALGLVMLGLSAAIEKDQNN